MKFNKQEIDLIMSMYTSYINDIDENIEKMQEILLNITDNGTIDLIQDIVTNFKIDKFKALEVVIKANDDLTIGVYDNNKHIGIASFCKDNENIKIFLSSDSTGLSDFIIPIRTFIRIYDYELEKEC